MSDMPERIWAWREERYGTTWAITPGDKKAVEYRRANLHSLPGDVVEALSALPGGVWETWTSNSFRRISRVGGGDGDVLHATRHSDGCLDLSWTEDECNAVCTLVNRLRALAAVERKP